LALAAWPRYRGRVVLLTSAVNLDGGTWPLSPSFAAMVQELLPFAVSGRLREHAAAVGDPLEEYLPAGAAGLDAEVVTPDGQAQAVQTLSHEDGGVLRFGETEQSGLYRATLAPQPQEYLFAVNVPTSAGESQLASESDLSRAGTEELRATFPGWDFQVVTDLRDVTPAHTGGISPPAGTSPPPNEGTDTSPAPRGEAGRFAARGLLLAVLTLVLIEVVLAWRFGHYDGAAGTTAAAPVPGGRLIPILVAVVAGLSLVVLASVLGHAAWTDDFLGFLGDNLRRQLETGDYLPDRLPAGVRHALALAPDLTPPAPGESPRWRLEAAPGTPAWLTDPWAVGGLALAAAVLVGLVYRREGPATTRWPYRFLLSGLRLYLVLLALLVLLPQLQLRVERQSWPDIAIVLDTSRSMSHSDHYQDAAEREAATRLAEGAALSTPQRLQLAQALVRRRADERDDWLTALLRHKFKVHLYTCAQGRAWLADVTEPDEHARGLQALDALQAEGETSALGTALSQVLDDFSGRPLAAVIMLTDGVTTEGEDLARVAQKRRGVPLFLVGIGDAHEERDLDLHDLQVEKAVYVNDRVVFEARLAGKGYPDLTVTVTLRERTADGKEVVLATQPVRVDPQGKPVPVRLVHQPATPGKKTYVLEVPVQPDEKRPADNNRLECTVFVQEVRVIRVLYVEGSARYEYRYLKNLLERESSRDPRNKTIDLSVLLLDADDEYASQDRSARVEFPTREELGQYDVVILGDVDPKSAKLGERNLKYLADFVRDGGGLLAMAGPRWNPRAFRDTPLAAVLPVEVLDVPPRDEDRLLADGYRLERTAAGRLHPILRFHPEEAENTAIWTRQLAELLWWAEGYRVKPGAEVLAVHPGRSAADPHRPRAPGEEGHPLMVQQFVGAGRSIFLGFDETWRWRLREHELRFNQFWIQAVRYLARGRLGQINLFLDRQTAYRRGMPIKVTIQFPDNAPPLDPQTDVQVLVERRPLPPVGTAEAEVQTLRLAKLAGTRATYEGLLTRTPEGEYRFWLSAPAVPAAQRPQALARVRPPPGEMDRLTMNQPDLEQAARATHGRFFTLAAAERLVEELPAGTRVAVETLRAPQTLWNRAGVFGLALGLLSCEWLLRKRKHLL
jgi:hypothetical protein